jgi:hypothetical protein
MSSEERVVDTAIAGERRRTRPLVMQADIGPS